MPDDVDLTEVPLSDLVAELQRRALERRSAPPGRPNHHPANFEDWLYIPSSTFDDPRPTLYRIPTRE